MSTFIIIIISIALLLLLGYLTNLAMGNKNYKEVVDEKVLLKEEEDKYIKSLSTSSPIKKLKYTKILNKIEKNFVDIYNFETPNEYKTEDSTLLLAQALLFEGARQEKLSSNDFIKFMICMNKHSFTKYITITKSTEYEVFKTLYLSYIDFRARNIRPIIAMMITWSSLEGDVSTEEIRILSEDYESNPRFGRSV